MLGYFYAGQRIHVDVSLLSSRLYIIEYKLNNNEFRLIT